MKIRPELPRPYPAAVSDFPAWARGKQTSSVEMEEGYLSGAAVLLLDQVVRSEPVWGGVWRHRLALTSAAAVLQIEGRGESEPQLRDALLFTAPGDDPGPSAQVLMAWRKMVLRRPSLSQEVVSGVLKHLSLAWNEELSVALENVEELLRSSRAAPFVAAEVASEVYRATPTSEAFALWVADVAFAAKLRWSNAVPLLAGQILGPLFRRPGERRRIRPGEADWVRSAVIAYGSAAQSAHGVAVELSARAEKMLSIMPTLRAKGAGQVVQLLLDDDAVSASFSGSQISSRSARRLFERLSQAGVVRELSGRSTFKIYGL